MTKVIPAWELAEGDGTYHLPAAERTVVPARDVRNWAKAKGFQVGTRGHLPGEVIAEFNRAHRFVRFIDTNPRRKP